MAIYVFCGADGMGKTTISQLLAKILGKPYVKFPYGSDNDTKEEIYSGKKIRELLNNKEHPCDPVAFQALQLVNKLEAVEVIKERERIHDIVIVDRWSLSAIIYGAADGVDVAWSEKIAKMFDEKIKPTIMFVFTGVPYRRETDIYGDKQKKIMRMYDDFCIKNRNNTSVVEISVTGKSIEAVALEVLGHITKDVSTNKRRSNLSTCGTTSVVSKPNPNIITRSEWLGSAGVPQSCNPTSARSPALPRATDTCVSTNHR